MGVTSEDIPGVNASVNYLDVRVTKGDRCKACLFAWCSQSHDGILDVRGSSSFGNGSPGFGRVHIVLRTTMKNTYKQLLLCMAAALTTRSDTFSLL